MKKRRKYRNRSELARRRKLPSLVERHGSKCYWCGEDIKMRRSIPNETIVGEKHGIVNYWDNGVVRTIRLASVDHLKPLSKGGDNRIENLVASCWDCNNNRSNAALSN